MTPLAAQLARHGEATWKLALAGCQFFECTTITPMAYEMAAADGRDAPYSEFAVLPFAETVLEVWTEVSGRVMYICSQDGPMLRYTCWDRSDGASIPRLRFASGFVLAKTENLDLAWATDDLLSGQLTSLQIEMALGSNALIEKLLCILNQPDLIERRPRATDKRVLREVGAVGITCSSTWHECRVRPGLHQNPGRLGSRGDTQMPLHYVRKHFRPSASRWVEGYWRGNEQFGLHLKWYSAAASRVA